jgi:hypothetical protein
MELMVGAVPGCVLGEEEPPPQFERKARRTKTSTASATRRQRGAWQITLIYSEKMISS